MALNTESSADIYQDLVFKLR